MRFNKFSVFELMRSDWLIIEVLRPKLKFSTEVRVPKALLSLMSLADGCVVPFFRSDIKSIWTWQRMSHFILSKVEPVHKKTSKMIFERSLFDISDLTVRLDVRPVHDALVKVWVRGNGDLG